jgi:hypothetical protein
MWYQDNLNFTTDVQIIFLTAYSIFFPQQRLIYRVFKNLPLAAENGELPLTNAFPGKNKTVRQKEAGMERSVVR